jgi:hypothetical protein
MDRHKLRRKTASDRSTHRAIRRESQPRRCSFAGSLPRIPRCSSSSAAVAIAYRSSPFSSLFRLLCVIAPVELTTAISARRWSDRSRFALCLKVLSVARPRRPRRCRSIRSEYDLTRITLIDSFRSYLQLSASAPRLGAPRPLGLPSRRRRQPARLEGRIGV